MTILLLIIIAVLLLVIASKVAPRELEGLWPLLIVGGIIYLIFQFWQFILAIPFLAFFALKEFFNSELFEGIAATVGYFLLIFAVGYFVYWVYNDWKQDHSKARIKRIVKDVWTIFWKVSVYTLLGLAGFAALGVLIFFLSS